METEAFLSAIQQAGRQIRGTSLSPRPWSMVALSAAAVVGMAAFLLRVPMQVGWQEARLHAMRGAVGAKVTAHRPLFLKLDLTGLPLFSSFRLQIVNTSGRPVFIGAVSAENPEFKMDGLPSGLYFVRLSSPEGELLREYGLTSER